MFTDIYDTQTYDLLQNVQKGNFCLYDLANLGKNDKLMQYFEQKIMHILVTVTNLQLFLCAKKNTSVKNEVYDVDATTKNMDIMWTSIEAQDENIDKMYKKATRKGFFAFLARLVNNASHQREKKERMLVDECKKIVKKVQRVLIAYKEIQNEQQQIDTKIEFLDSKTPVTAENDELQSNIPKNTIVDVSHKKVKEKHSLQKQ